MKYLFGPVNSRRLGLSQGIDLIPSGACNFKCIYCEVKQPKKLTSERREYSPTRAIIDEIKSLFANRALARTVDAFTITASGEPTLHTGIDAIIQFIKANTDKPVTVLTNGGMLHLPEVRKILMAADIVVPSLDAARTESFRRINRPVPGTSLDTLITGISQFKREFQGQLWLEILLALGINDAPEDIQALKKAIDRIGPDKIQLNTVVRPPFESFAKPLPNKILQKIAGELGNSVEIIASFVKKDNSAGKTVTPFDIIELLKRRPGTTSDICEALQADPAQINGMLQCLVKENKIKATEYCSQDYWIVNEEQLKEQHA